MEIVVKTPSIQDVERIEISGNIHEIYGIKSSKSFKGYMNARIKHFIKVGNKEEEMKLRTILGVYERFHPALKETININGWKGKGTFQVQEFPEYFLITEWRKIDWKDKESGEEAKPVETKLYRKDFNNFLKAFFMLEIGKKYATKEVAEIWARENHLWENAHGKKIFSNDGFDYSRISGCRTTYMLIYYPIKILQEKDLIHYEKHGFVTRLEGEIKIQGEFI